MQDNFPNFADKVMQRTAPKGEDPYSVFERDYWSRPREICVVDEINPLPGNACEVICGTQEKNEIWVMCLARTHKFSVTKITGKDGLGQFFKFIIRK